MLNSPIPKSTWVDDHQGSFGIADVVSTAFDELSFTTGICFYFELPDYIDLNCGNLK